jgi:hypothetical protein
MNPVRWKYLSAVFLVLSLTLLVSVIVLPGVKSPQHVVYRGPAGSFEGGQTAISGYYIPTVDGGSTVTVSIQGFVPGNVDISIFPSETGGISPIGGPVYIKTPLINSTVTFRAESTQAYGIYVISRNGTNFTVVVEATYSPYYRLFTYASVGVILTFASAILLYYYNFTSKRWKLEQQAIHEARGEGLREQDRGS